MHKIVDRVRKTLRQAGDPDESEKGGRVFKEEVRLLGVPVPIVKKIAAESFALLKEERKATVFALCGELWRSGFVEDSWVACEWSYAVRNAYEAGDMDVFESWLNDYVDNWATCDTLCNHSVGHLLESHPQCSARTERWARSPNRWLRRGAAVSYIIPARKGLFLDAVFSVADALLEDEDDLVRKGYGWALKAASESHRDKVYDFVAARHASMPRTAFRYALEKMPPELRKRAMALRPIPTERGRGRNGGRKTD